MIPISSADFEESDFFDEQTSLTYEIRKDEERIREYVDGLEAVCQSIYKILMTERGRFEIYDENFGISLDDLFGKSVVYIECELPVRISEALLFDERILKVFDFSFSRLKEKGVLLTKFFVETIFGETSFDLEVDI